MNAPPIIAPAMIHPDQLVRATRALERLYAAARRPEGFMLSHRNPAFMYRWRFHTLDNPGDAWTGDQLADVLPATFSPDPPPVLAADLLDFITATDRLQQTDYKIIRPAGAAATFLAEGTKTWIDAAGQHTRRTITAQFKAVGDAVTDLIDGLTAPTGTAG